MMMIGLLLLNIVISLLILVGAFYAASLTIWIIAFVSLALLWGLWYLFVMST